MTQEEIIEMVMQIGGCDRPEHDSPALKMFVAFAKLVAEKERPWVGLTDEEIDKILKVYEQDYNWTSFAKAIEAKLKEKNT